MIIIFMFIIGLAVGSFIDASAWRFHEQEANRVRLKHDNKRRVDPQNLSIATGRSMCEHCGHTLAPNDLVPLFSWLYLRGRCRYCGAKLSWEYPLSELITALLFVISYMVWDFSDAFGYVAFGFWLLFLPALVFLIIYDLKWMILPNRVIYPMIATITAFTIIESVFFAGGINTIKDSVFGALFIGGVFYGLFAISNGKWIGGGDVKLGIFIGLLLGLSKSVLTFVLAFNIASLVMLPLLVFGVVSRKSRIPFGPFLILATAVSVLYGSTIIQWYELIFTK